MFISYVWYISYFVSYIGLQNKILTCLCLLFVYLLVFCLDTESLHKIDWLETYFVNQDGC